MMRLDAIAALFPDLETVELITWVERRWVEPEPGEDGGWVFHEIDVARVRLIYDLRRELEVAEETVPVVLSLLDQLYELRATLKSVMHAIEGQPPEVKAAVAAVLEERSISDAASREGPPR
ncbi:MAG TPA: chaperone modulator CbpM [Alphaproteobacteria bacterium]|nr:chaperone modulator CbpM [Alphaproteobacteria bacterium]